MFHSILTESLAVTAGPAAARWAVFGLVSAAAAATYFPATASAAVKKTLRITARVPAAPLPPVPHVELPEVSVAALAAAVHAGGRRVWAAASAAVAGPAPVPTAQPSSASAKAPPAVGPAGGDCELEDHGQSTPEDAATYVKH